MTISDAVPRVPNKFYVMCATKCGLYRLNSFRSRILQLFSSISLDIIFCGQPVTLNRNLGRLPRGHAVSTASIGDHAALDMARESVTF